MHKLSYFMIVMVVIISASIFLAPVFSQSTNPCSSCHGGGYSQYLQILEGNAGNQLPTTLALGQTVTVTVVVENIVNTARYSELYSVSMSLSSQNGHFSVAVPTFNIGTLEAGTAIATWQITGVSEGQDSLIITANAINSHEHLQFSDSYWPSPAVMVSVSGQTTPAPTPIPTLTSSPINPTPIPIQAPLSNPTRAPTSTTKPTPSPISPIVTSPSVPVPTVGSLPQSPLTASPSPIISHSVQPIAATYLIAIIILLAVAIAIIVAKVVVSYHPSSSKRGEKIVSTIHAETLIRSLVDATTMPFCNFGCYSQTLKRHEQTFLKT